MTAVAAVPVAPTTERVRHVRTQTQDLIAGTIVGVVATALSYFVAIAVGWLTTADLNWLEVFAVFTSYVCTFLCVRQRRINYPIGAVSTAAYAVLFFQSDLLSSAVLNLYLTPTLVYGWIRWRADNNARPVGRVKLRWWPVYLAVTAAFYVGASLISSAFGAAFAWTDALILAGTVLAQFLLDNKKLENWVIWAAVNVLAIYTYGAAGLWLVMFQYVLFLLNTFFGFVMWRKSERTGVAM